MGSKTVSLPVCHASVSVHTRTRKGKDAPAPAPVRLLFLGWFSNVPSGTQVTRASIIFLVVGAQANEVEKSVWPGKAHPGQPKVE